MDLSNAATNATATISTPIAPAASNKFPDSAAFVNIYNAPDNAAKLIAIGTKLLAKYGNLPLDKHN